MRGAVVSARGQPLLAGAETVYVSNELKLAVHQKASLDSPVIRLVPMGAPLELLERKGPISHVRIGTGVDGWVQSTFLSAKPPASDDRSAEQASALNTARTELKAMEQRAIIAETKLLTLEATKTVNDRSDSQQSDNGQSTSQSNNDARANSENAESTGEPPPQDPRPLPAAMDSAAHSEVLRDVERLTLMNQRLREQLAARDADAQQSQSVPADAAAAAGIAAAAGLDGAAGDDGPSAVAKAMASLLGDLETGPIDWLPTWSRWQWLFSACAGLLALSLGAWVVDSSVRRRLGGFTV